MDKEKTISFIKDQLKKKIISKDDLSNITNYKISYEENSKKLTHVFYIIGAIIAVLGIAVLLGQNWDSIGYWGRVFSTVGVSFITYLIGLVLVSPEHRTLSQIMFVVSAILSIFGSFVLLMEAGMVFSLNSQIIISIVLSIIYGAALTVSKKNILTLVFLGFISWFYYAFIIKILNISLYNFENYIIWATIFLSISYILIAYSYPSFKFLNNLKERNIIQSILYFIGTLMFLGSWISLDGVFNLIFIAVIFFTFYISVYLRSRSMLVLVSIFLMAHIIKLTSKFFVDSLGWSISLIATGFLIMGIGYTTFYINKRFFSKK